jgi:hypothetical protein
MYYYNEIRSAWASLVGIHNLRLAMVIERLLCSTSTAWQASSVIATFAAKTLRLAQPATTVR